MQSRQIGSQAREDDHTKPELSQALDLGPMVDDTNPALPECLNEPRLWEVWYIPYYG